jgi:pSer/pThr/pTyr-binding forkhead associated (FHA) protein
MVMHTERFIQLGDYAEGSRGLDPATFAQRFGEAFFLHHGPLGDLKMAVDQKRTISLDAPLSPVRRSFNPQADYLVFPIHKTVAENPDKNVFWVGRVRSNEIVVPDESVSAVHAYLVRGAGGEFDLQDMSSQNGTFVNGQLVAAQGRGDPTRLDSGDRVTFGGVNLTFLKMHEFRNLIASLLV